MTDGRKEINPWRPLTSAATLSMEALIRGLEPEGGATVDGEGTTPVFRQKTADPDFWSRRAGLRDIDLAVKATAEDIRPGSGEGWGALWERTEAADEDAKQWEAFYAGDDSKRREERWLLGA